MEGKSKYSRRDALRVWCNVGIGIVAGFAIGALAGILIGIFIAWIANIPKREGAAGYAVLMIMMACSWIGAAVFGVVNGLMARCGWPKRLLLIEVVVLLIVVAMAMAEEIHRIIR